MANGKVSKDLKLGFKENGFKKEEKNLQIALANSIFIYNLYKKYHWHVRGRDFYQYHLLFDEHAKQQLPIIDSLAERLRTLGFMAPGMPGDVERNKSVNEPDTSDFTPLVLCESLLKVHDAYLKHLRSTIDIADEVDDEGTEDFLVSDVLRVHELQVWFLRSSIENTEVIT